MLRIPLSVLFTQKPWELCAEVPGGKDGEGQCQGSNPDLLLVAGQPRSGLCAAQPGPLA